jgi:hypothetical protein
VLEERLSCLSTSYVADLVKPNARDFGRKSKREVEMKDAQQISLPTTITIIPTHRTEWEQYMRAFDLHIPTDTKNMSVMRLVEMPEMQRNGIFHVIVHGPPRVETGVAGIHIPLRDLLPS